MSEPLPYYATHSRLSSPDAFASAYTGLPASLPGLVQIVQNATIHVFWVERYGVKPPPERMAELQLRSMERRLGRTFELDARPLVEPRPAGLKLLGNCRDHTLLLVSMLRSQGVPARARCGFADYFLPGHFEDHWVAEYWNAAQARWVLVDAQLDALQRGVLQIDFDPLDVPRARFLTGGKAWQVCRLGEQDPARFGIFDMSGLGFVRGNLVRDLAALNKVELLPWDCWGVILSETLDDPADLQALDAAAALAAGDAPDFAGVQTCYSSDARLRMDGSLLSFVNGEMAAVRLD